MRARGHRRAAGFTLIELLIAITLLAMMTLAVFGGLRFGARAWETGAARMAEQRAAAASLDLLRGIVAGAAPILILPGGDTASSIEGGPDRLRVAAPWPRPVGTGGLQLFEAGADPSGGGLVLEWGLARRLGDPAARETRRLPGATGLRLRYHGVDAGSGMPGWTDRWQGRNSLPRLVEIRLLLEGGMPGPRAVVRVAAAVSG